MRDRIGRKRERTISRETRGGRNTERERERERETGVRER